MDAREILDLLSNGGWGVAAVFAWMWLRSDQERRALTQKVVRLVESATTAAEKLRAAVESQTEAVRCDRD